MSLQDKVRARRKLSARFAWAAAVGAGFLLATSIEAAAATYALECDYQYNDGVLFNSRNITGRPIPHGTKITLTICDESGCRTVVGMVWNMGTDVMPGEKFIFLPVVTVNPKGAVRCSAAMWVADGPLRPGEAPESARIKPSVEPKALDAERSRQTRSGINTPPPPPTAPPGAELTCSSNWYGGDPKYFGTAYIHIQNTTGGVIKAGTRVILKVCDKNGCRTETFVVKADVPPGHPVIIAEVPTPATTCTATIWSPFAPREKIRVPEYSRIKPPGPPQPGLLEDSPAYLRQTPSNVGTPKPSAPPPSPRGAAPLR